MTAAVEYRRLTPEQANGRIAECKEVCAAVFGQPPYNEAPEMADTFAAWVRDESTEPGFAFVEAVDGGRVAGFAYGYSRPVGEWSRGADRPIPGEVAVGPTFAVMEWAVLPDYRRRGVGRRLMDELLTDRPERYAVLTVNPAADARHVYEHLGWRHVASTRPGRSPGMDVMLLEI